MSEADPTRIVADADVLAADLLAGGPARTALNQIRRHDWLDLLASDPLLDDATAIITTLADDALATSWRQLIDDERVAVSHPEGDHPALASAYRGEAAHLLTFDDGLASAATNRSLQPHVTISVRSPDAFARLFDPESLYNSRHDDEYSGPDR
jgi:predicted nucleic acid-binding protein